MCCAFTTLVLLGPRIFILMWWLFDPTRWQLAFSSFLWPMLGWLFLPWTTLMFVLVAPGGNIIGLDWLWLGLALMSDIGSYGGGAYGNRERIPGYAR